MGNLLSAHKSGSRSYIFKDLEKGETQECSICLKEFKKQQTGLLETCEHSFCAQCILQWSKHHNTCPLDYKIYDSVIIQKYLEGPTIRAIDIKDIKRFEKPQEECQSIPYYILTAILLLCGLMLIFMINYPFVKLAKYIFG